MLEPSSSTRERTSAFASKPDPRQRAFHAAVRAARRRPERGEWRERGIGAVAQDRLGGLPIHRGIEAQKSRRVSYRFVRGAVGVVSCVVIADDANADSHAAF